MDNSNIEIRRETEDLFVRVSALIEQARAHVSRTVNSTMAHTYHEIGRYIVEDEQKGESRAKCGKRQLKELSARLTDAYGNGWGETNLRSIRLFYLIYSKRMNANLADSVCQIRFTLSWSHYQLLMRIENDDERSFYEIECERQNWSVRQLQRQYNSSLYERLALSRDKEEVMRLASVGQKMETMNDLRKEPVTLEFLGLKPDAVYFEKKVESAILSKLQDFLLEMGKGFLFEARQKRFTFREDNYYVDLVLYNRLLRCYVLIDLKMDKLTHQDLGQMQMYVNYYDRYEKLEDENPTIGILLCKEKDDALVELTLPKDANIFAQQYALYLPDKNLLQAKLKEWIEEFESENTLIQ